MKNEEQRNEKLENKYSSRVGAISPIGNPETGNWCPVTGSALFLRRNEYHI